MRKLKRELEKIRNDEKIENDQKENFNSANFVLVENERVRLSAQQ